MKILQTPMRLSPTGGVESYVRNLSKELLGMGHEVRVVCTDEPGENEVDKRIRLETLRCMGKIANTRITPYLPLALLKEDFDILHTHLPTPWSADWSSLVSKYKKRPLILTYHNDIVGQGFAKYIAKIYNKSALKMLLNSADGIIVTRGSHRSPYLEAYVEKIFIIPVGVDVELFRPQEVPAKGDIFFLSVLDEYHRYKGLEILLGALKILKQEMPDVKLIVGGSGDLVEFYMRIACSLGLKDNVKFAGFISSEQLLDYYNGCKLFVLPSTDPRREGFGIVPLEAMACQRPVITTNIVGMAEDIKKSGSGMVVGCTDKDALASSMLCILKDEDLAKRMGAFGRKLAVEKYSWRRAAEQIEKVYRGFV